MNNAEPRSPLFSVLLFGLLLCFFSLPPICRAEENAGPVATVVALRGKVEAIDAAGKSRPLAVKDPIHAADSIKTGPRGRIQILFTDNTIYSLSDNSEMQISQYSWQPDKKEGELKTKVKEGVFRVMGGAITKHSPENFTTETPAATIGIRGSMYAGTVTGKSLSVVFQGGKGITVTNPFGTVEISQPGFGTKASTESAPTPPAKFSEQEVASLNKEASDEAEDNGEETEETTTGEEQEEGESSSAAADETTDEEEAAPAVAEETASTDESTGETEPAALPETDDAATTTDIALAGETTVAAVTSEPVVAPVVEVPPPNETSPIIDPVAPAPVLPTDGLTGYVGDISGTANLVDGTIDTFSDPVWIEINWHSGKALGRIGGLMAGPSVFFIGDIRGNEIVNVKILGTGADQLDSADPTQPFPTITALNGSGSGLILGENYDFLNFSASGSGYEIAPPSQPLFDTWSAQGTTTREVEDTPDDAVSPRGIRAWKGFVTSVAENMTNIDSNRRLFMNRRFNEFYFTLDKDNGTITGKLSASDVTGGGAALVGIDIGGALPSAFILEDNFAAVMGCPSGACVETNGSTGGLKKYTNYLVTADPDINEIGDYISWGFWEVAYTDPASREPYHAHAPGSRWIAGEPTPLTELQNLANTHFIGHYGGPVLATRIDTDVQEFKGSFAIDVDFANLNAASAIQGVIKIDDGTTFNVANTAMDYATTGGFHGFVSHPTKTVYDSEFNGAFFGPHAESIGGNFHAGFDTRSYVGIFGGNR